VLDTDDYIKIAEQFYEEQYKDCSESDRRKFLLNWRGSVSKKYSKDEIQSIEIALRILMSSAEEREGERGEFMAFIYGVMERIKMFRPGKKQIGGTLLITAGLAVLSPLWGGLLYFLMKVLGYETTLSLEPSTTSCILAGGCFIGAFALFFSKDP